MPEVKDELFPTDGLTNADVQFAGLDMIKGTGGATFRFDLRDEDENYVGTFPIVVGPNEQGVDGMIAEAHSILRDVLRQWLHQVDLMHDIYAARAAGSTPTGRSAE